MLDLFRSLTGLIKLDRIRIEYEIFRLHYTFTVLFLLVFCLLATMKQYIGKPIDCMGGPGIPSSIIDTYCWIHATYTITSAYNKKVGIDVPHPGIDATQDENLFKYHKYYQWVWFMLFFQAVLFYVPRWLWRIWEGGKMQTLTMNLDTGLLGESEKKAKKKQLVNYFMLNWRNHDWYAGKYFLCELLAFVNVVGQMFLLNVFFEGQFLTYGIEVVNYAILEQPNDQLDPMIQIFPRVTKCRFHKYGPTGTLEVYDALCLLPLNIINEKIYIFLWFWFVMLGSLTGVTLVFHVLLCAFPPIRVYVLSMRYRFANSVNLHTLLRKGSFGDWFLIYMLGRNVDHIIFREIIDDLVVNILKPRNFL